MGEYADKNELYHWMKGAEKANHKYISRNIKNGKWQYVYNRLTSGGGQRDNRSFKDRFKDWMGYDERKRMSDSAMRLANYNLNNKKKQKETGTIDREAKARTRAYQKA